MSRKGMNRRQFLQTSGLAAAGAAAGSGVGGASQALAGEMVLTTLDAHSAATLLAMIRRTYPHETLADMYYGGVVEALDSEAKGSKDTETLLLQGVADLDAAMGLPFLHLSEGNQLAVLQAMADGAFFQKVRGTTIVALYNNPLVWRHFGCEGPSFDFGGYIDRGFADLSWLPRPSDDASPKAG